jgi:TolB protein
MKRALVALALILATPSVAQTPSDVRIDITSGQTRRIRIHCESLRPDGDRGAGETSVQADAVLANDLETSAVFTVTRSWVAGEQPFDVQAVVGGKWTVNGSQVRFTGEVRDMPARRPILVKEYRAPLTQWRELVHRFADDVVLQFTGEAGVAGTRIAFVDVEGRDKELCVMDLDGTNLRQLTHDRSIALSPSWSPDGSLLLFTSYRGGKGPQVFVTPASGGKIFLISGRAGNNTSASYSPDGREIACTLSLDGNPEIYLLDARGGSPRRLTNSRSIDTSPSWSPTGREIAFTSDRTGTPQVYVMDREGGNVRRLNYEVNYTDSPAWSPRGDRIAFVARNGSGFDIYVCRPDGSDSRLVVSGRSNENPHWSPDGSRRPTTAEAGHRWSQGTVTGVVAQAAERGLRGPQRQNAITWEVAHESEHETPSSYGTRARRHRSDPGRVRPEVQGDRAGADADSAARHDHRNAEAGRDPEARRDHARRNRVPIGGSAARVLRLRLLRTHRGGAHGARPGRTAPARSSGSEHHDRRSLRRARDRRVQPGAGREARAGRA